MHYLVYIKSTGMLRIDYSTRNEDAGIIGSIEDMPEPLASANTRDAITEIAYAHLGRHPSDMLYIADSNGLLYEIVISQPYHDERSAQGKAIVVAWTCFVLSTVSLIATVFLGLGYLGLILLVAFIMLYLAIVRSGFFNEVEAGVFCFIFIVLAALLIPAIHEAWQKSQDRTNHPMNGSGSRAFWQG